MALKDIQRLDFGKLGIKETKPASFYETEAKKAIRRLNTADKNFKYFIKAIIKDNKENVDIETWRDVISELQRYVCRKINIEESDDTVLVPIRNKIKKPKKEWAWTND